MQDTHRNPWLFAILKLLFLTTHYYKNTNNFAESYYDTLFFTKHTNHSVYTKNSDHDVFLFHCWNRRNTCIVNKKKHHQRTQKANTSTTKKSFTSCRPTKAPKADPSVTPILKILSTIDTNSSLHGYANMLINIMIWSQPLVQFQMMIQYNTHNIIQSQPPRGTAIE